ncbi:MAG: thioredoxin 1 [Candidatus Promineifilaceae bacterium]|jgi:thioredoxin 1
MQVEETDLTIAVTDENWQSVVVDAETPVLVDFGTEWNGECRQMDSVLDEIADDMWGELRVVRVNVDNSPGLAAEFGVKFLPTLLVLQDGCEEDRMVGAVSKIELEKRVSCFVEVA